MLALPSWQLAYCCVVIVAAYAVRGGTGFGSAAAMPLLALVVPLKILVPVWTLLGVASSVTIVADDYRQVAWREMVGTVPAGLIGIAAGLYVFKTLDTRTLTLGLGALVIAYGCWSLWTTTRATTKPLRSPILAHAAGFLGGLVGTTFGTMASIFYAIYFDAIRLAKANFRATMSAMMLTLSVLRGAGYFAVGEFGRDALIAFAFAFPLMLLGIFIGDRFHADMPETAFRRAVAVLLVISGAALLAK
ncbi:MAG: sulfite exporter TauE/SafE family protein [Alphaproteobacteria bacterium]